VEFFVIEYSSNKLKMIMLIFNLLIMENKKIDIIKMEKE
jgi:hypothetical protein